MWCIILYVYLIIAVVIAIVYFIKSFFEITKEERQSLQIEYYVGGSIACILIVGLFWPISWPLWLFKE